MIGLLLNYKEVQEIEYLLKKEMEELLLDLSDPRIDSVVKREMEEEYQLIFTIYRRIASPKDCMKYIRQNTNKKSN